ncbi:DUF2993 domain-containing protein [Corynebacterium tapiri]|uniref:DUF2993 domain-containing protein n=1 Tax=Corynebacterium tapiri TaxID=1448266 RepID=A0A5C4U292_9CORY|nr:DUF2993 domain-containing protein [Corynebacterium tapiri]
MALVGLLGWLIDSAIAMRVEAKISSAVEESADLATSPAVYVGGVPYVTALLTGEIPQVTVTSLDINVEDLGIVNARTEINRVHVTPQQALSGDLYGAPGELFKRTVSLDGVAFGQLLGITDLDISNPYDISPAGGVASEAKLTGTPKGFEDKVTVVVDLRLESPTFHMRVREVQDAPAGREQEAADAFTFSMDTRRLPLSSQASNVSVSAGSIVFETQRQNIVVRPGDLAPLDTGDAADEDSSAWRDKTEAGELPAATTR